jgi:hypothetical protein
MPRAMARVALGLCPSLRRGVPRRAHAEAVQPLPGFACARRTHRRPFCAPVSSLQT